MWLFGQAIKENAVFWHNILHDSVYELPTTAVKFPRLSVKLPVPLLLDRAGLGNPCRLLQSATNCWSGWRWTHRRHNRPLIAFLMHWDVCIWCVAFLRNATANDSLNILHDLAFHNDNTRNPLAGGMRLWFNFSLCILIMLDDFRMPCLHFNSKWLFQSDSFAGKMQKCT